MSSSIKGVFSSVRERLSETAERATSAAKSATNELKQEAKQDLKHVAEKVEDAFDSAKVTIANAPELIARNVERPYATAHDGFVAYDPSGKIVGGRAPSATLRDFDAPKTALDPLLRFANRAEQGQLTFELPDGSTLSSKTGGDGKSSVSLSSLSGAGLDAKRGGLLDIGVSTPEGTSDHARTLALPANYDGPVFVCDIDDTLRPTKYADVLLGRNQAPIDGAQALLSAVAKQGIPIVYLSAGSDKMRALNTRFLEQFPPGVLLDRTSMGLGDLLPTNSHQADVQGEYKTRVLNELKSTFPNAQLFGLGDDKYGDATAYTRAGATAYIHDVPKHDNLPADFHGIETKNYSSEFIQKVSVDLQAAVQRSASFGGTPVKVDAAARTSAELDRVTGTKLIPGNSVQFLVDGENAFPEIVKGLDGASKSICYETYNLLPNDPVSSQLVDHLIAAKARGVDVKVQLDAFGAREFPLVGNALVDRLKKSGVEVQFFNPIDGIGDLNPKRDHRKTIVIDGSSAFVGGMNSAEQWMGGPEVKGRWHDVFAKLQGPAVQEVAKSFVQSWTASGGKAFGVGGAGAPATAGKVPMRIISHVPGKDRNIEAAYLALIDNAQQSINVENTFPLDEAIKDALISAAQRGVRVRYIIGTGQGILGEATEGRLQELLDAGVEVYAYPDRVHTKALSVDGRFATVGSSNLDAISMDHNREIISLIEDPATVQQLDQALFDRDLVADSQGRKTVRLPSKLSEPLWDRLKDGFIRGVWPGGLQ